MHVATTPREHSLDSRAVTFFRTFGFLRLKGYLADGIDEINAAFDEVTVAAGEPVVAADHKEMFAALADSKPVLTHQRLNFGTARTIIPHVLDLDPRLRALRDDPRILAVVDALLPAGSAYHGSDGNIFDGDTGWHYDLYGTPIDVEAIKLFVYLDPLDAESGALRVIPGTSHYQSDFATSVRESTADHAAIEKVYGVDWDEIPAAVVESQPGDLIVGDLRNIHATVNGRPGRRMFTMSFRESA